MPTVIDSLVVRLGLDSKDFQRGTKAVKNDFDRTKSEAQQTAKKVEQSGQKASEFFKELRKSALQFFSVLTVGGGVVSFAKNVISTGASLDRMGKRIDESASNLSRWQGAVRQSGGSADGFLSTVQNLSQQFTQLKETGDAPIRMLLTQLGVSAADATGKAKPILTLLRDIGDSLEGKQWAGADKFNKLLSAGFDEGTINLLMRGRAEREKLLASQKEYTDKDASAARKAEENWERIKLQIERTSQTLVIKLLPIVEKIAAGMAAFADKAVPVLGAMIDGFLALDKVTDGWLSTLAIALVSLKAITGLLSLLGIGGGAAAAGAGAATGGAAAGGAAAGAAKAGGGLLSKAAGALKGGLGLGALFYSGGLNNNEQDELAKHRAKWDPIVQGGKQTLTGVGAGKVGASSTSSTTVSVGEVKVYTQATDANGIARDMRAAIVRQSDGGMR
jgi:hypothetical protein